MAQDGSKFFSNHRLILGVAWAQGGREYMQDAFSLNLGNSGIKESNMDYFGVFDGHGPNGENISTHVAQNLNDFVVADYIEDKSSTFPQSIENGCLQLDTQMRKDQSLMSHNGNVLGGSTACAVWVMDEYIYSGNVGDSRFIISYNGKAYNVSEDHKPSSSEEKNRIESFGGFVKNNRVNGGLAVSRSFGDYQYKTRTDLDSHQQLVTAIPEVRTVEIEPDIDFLVIASDGVWDLMTNQQVVDFIMNRMPINLIGEAILQNCTLPINPSSGMGSDNMTVIIVILR